MSHLLDGTGPPLEQHVENCLTISLTKPNNVERSQELRGSK